MADPAGGRLNVNRHIADPYYRYKMPAAAVTDPHPRRKVIKDKAKKRNNKRMTKRERRQADREPREKRIHRPAAVISNGDAIADSLNRPIGLVARVFFFFWTDKQNPQNNFFSPLGQFMTSSVRMGMEDVCVAVGE